MMSSVGIRVASFRWRLPEASRLDKLKRRFALITRGMNVGQGNKKLSAISVLKLAMNYEPSRSCAVPRQHRLLKARWIAWFTFERTSQLQQLEKLCLGRQLWKALRVIAEENRAKVNFEVVEQLAESEQSDWKYFGRLRHEREKKLRDPQDVLIEADRLRRRIKTRPTEQRGTPQQ